MAQITIRQAASKYTVAYDTLYRMAIRHQEAFHAHAETMIGQPRPMWLLDDECDGFKNWLERYREKQEKRVSRTC